MIAYLRGKIRARDLGSVVLDVTGVGYKVFVPNSVLSTVGEVGTETELLIHTHVREDILALYGFSSQKELSTFELLITISGVGPKLALSVLSAISADDLEKAIASGSADMLTRISGVGKKTAERITMELKDKFGALGASFDGGDAVDVFEALASLGYSTQEIREGLKNCPEGSSTEDKVKYVLKNLAR